MRKKDDGWEKIVFPDLPNPRIERMKCINEARKRIMRNREKYEKGE